MTCDVVRLAAHMMTTLLVVDKMVNLFVQMECHVMTHLLMYAMQSDYWHVAAVN